MTGNAGAGTGNCRSGCGRRMSTGQGCKGRSGMIIGMRVINVILPSVKDRVRGTAPGPEKKRVINP